MSGASKYLAGTALTLDWLEKVLKSSCKNPHAQQAKLEKCSDTLIATGDGFMSHIIRVEMAWKPEITGLPHVVVIKVCI